MSRSDPVSAAANAAAASLPRLRRPARPPRPVPQGHAPAPLARDQGRYMPALDGLRAIAVLAVIAYHLNVGWAPGGLLGVGVFFVLSGYLITDLLIAQWERLGRIDLKDFWSRRARRLLPALWAMLVVVTAYVTVFDRPELGALRGDLLAAVLYVSNWWLTFHHVSYFASFGPPSPLGHLWSLAVEEQFYLLWPLLLALGLRLLPERRGVLAVVTLALAVGSAVAMAVLYQPGTDPSRVYYGTDTRAFALLIGAALAMVWPSRKLDLALPRRRRLALDAVGATCLLALLAMIWRTNEYQPFLYPVGLVLLSLASAGLIAALAHPASRLARVLAWGPLRWLGVRSYAIYLWHYPVIILTTPLVDGSTFGPWRALLQVTASIILAALSLRFIEAPVRRGALTRLVGAATSGWGGEVWRRMAARERVAALGAALVVLLAMSGVMGVGPSLAASTPASAPAAPLSPQPVIALASLRPTPTQVGGPTPNPTGGVPARGGGAAGPGGAAAGAGRARPGHTTPPPPAAAPACTAVTAIGDSIMLDAKPYLQAMLPGAYIDGLVGRQLYEAQATVARLKRERHLGDCVIIELGTNGPFTKAQLVGLLASLGRPRRIVLVNTRVPRPWQDVVNETLMQVAGHYPNVVLVNWYAASANKASWFWPDGVHLDPVGAKAYAALLVKALEPAPRHRRSGHGRG